jgi:hypothetical protein
VLLTAHDDEATAEDELRVLDRAVLPFDLELHLEAEGVAEPVDRGGRILVPDPARDARPSRGCRLHGSSSWKEGTGSDRRVESSPGS